MWLLCVRVWLWFIWALTTAPVSSDCGRHWQHWSSLIARTNLCKTDRFTYDGWLSTAWSVQGFSSLWHVTFVTWPRVCVCVCVCSGADVARLCTLFADGHYLLSVNTPRRMSLSLSLSLSVCLSVCVIQQVLVSVLDEFVVYRACNTETPSSRLAGLCVCVCVCVWCVQAV